MKHQQSGLRERIRAGFESAVMLALIFSMVACVWGYGELRLRAETPATKVVATEPEPDQMAVDPLTIIVAPT